MASDWNELAVQEFADVVGGGTPSTNDEQNFGGDIPWITPKDLSNHRFRYIERGERNITEKGFNESNATLLPAGSVLLSTRAPVGYLAIAKNPVTTNQGFKSLIVHDGFDNEFVYYLLKANVDYLKSQASGTTFGELSGGTLKKLRFFVPPLPEQRAIAGILGALDDKIELNRRMNRTLESIARAVFRQWFVESEEVGSWKVGKLGDVAENIRRGANADEINPDTNYIGLEHMPKGSIALSEWGNASDLASNKFVFKTGEFLFGKLRPYFHKVGIAPIDGVCSTDILVIAPKSPEWYGFVLEHISSVELINYTNAASTGTKMPRTSWSDIANYEVALPPLEKAKEFTKIFLPMAQQIRANIIESRTLASLRDSLLPKLMRGEVRVRG
ncbi:MAG: restriction endonuclease subunit S [Anaerolineales bacterium]